MSFRDGDISHVQVRDGKTGKLIGKIEYDNREEKVTIVSRRTAVMQAILKDSDTMEKEQRKDDEEKSRTEAKLEYEIQSMVLTEALTEALTNKKCNTILLNWNNTATVLKGDVDKAKRVIIGTLDLRDGGRPVEPDEIIIRSPGGRVNPSSGIEFTVALRKTGESLASFLLKSESGGPWQVSDLKAPKTRE